MKMTSKGQMKESGFWRSFFCRKNFNVVFAFGDGKMGKRRERR